MKINLYLMTEKGFEVIKAVSSNFLENDIFVIIGRDDSIENDYSSEIESFCISNKISFCFRGKLIREAEYSIAISWRWILNINNLIVVHDSLLPKYRGFAPLVNALKNGDKNIGVTAIFASQEFDRGDIIYQEKIKVEYPIKIKLAIALISSLYVKIVIKIMSVIGQDINLPRKKQNNNLATYSLWLDEADYLINWDDSADNIKRFVDATGFPYQGAQTRFMKNNELRKIKVLDVEVIEDVKIVNRDVGKIIFIDSGLPIVVCGFGLIKLIDAVDFNNNKSILPFKPFRIKFL